MGRHSKSRSLNLWANGLPVGTWVIPTRGEMELRYDAGWMESQVGRHLSLSLPFPVVGNAPLRGAKVGNYFENLLPDSESIKRRLATRFRTDSMEAFDLLAAIGRDCVGSLQLVREGVDPPAVGTITGTELSDAEVATAVRSAAGTTTNMGQATDDDEDFRISIAGAHEKTALLRDNGKWMRPSGATPTTHIFKLPLGLVGTTGRIDMSTSVENEWLCSRILKHYGLPVASSAVHDFDGQRVLVVERFDRRRHPSGDWILRLPQEDFCQAMGLPPRKKYESDGGPGINDVLDILNGSDNRAADSLTFFDAQILFWALAATDGHAKNFSIRIKARGRFEMTPLYDVLSIWPHVGKGVAHFDIHKAKLAMGMPGKSKHYRIKDIQRRHFQALGSRANIPVAASARIDELVLKTAQVVQAVQAELPADFPQSVSGPILSNLVKSMNRLGEMPDQ